VSAAAPIAEWRGVDRQRFESEISPFPGQGRTLYYAADWDGFNYLRNRLPLSLVLEQLLRYAGSTLHLAGEMFGTEAGVEIKHIPCKGTGPLTSDLLGGQLEKGFILVTAAAPDVKSGKQPSAFRPNNARRSCRMCLRSPNPAFPTTASTPGSPS
jgi:hypothetical protein